MSSLQVDSIAAIGGGHVDGTGKVVQCVYHQWNDITARTSTSFGLATGSTLSFTPKFADSLLVITYDYFFAVEWISGVIQTGGAAQIYHDGTALQSVAQKYELYNNALDGVSVGAAAMLARQTKINSVSAGSTSARDIQLYFASYTATSNKATVNREGNYSNLLVQEIAQ